MVYSGKCQEGAEGSTFWIFTPANGTDAIGGTWGKRMFASEEVAGARYTQGANYLGSGIAFSSTVNAASGMLVFGGMCPERIQSPSDMWTKAANYSNAMLNIKAPSSPSESIYTLGNSTGREPPIPEAGFTITPLEPTYSQLPNSQSRNQNFILLGGHTQEAFINMSQVALFSLPEQTWSFLPVDLPPNAPKTDLTRDVPSVEPRSGHTAVLTPDGRKIILFGGWVGDVTTMATPQLVVLELGEGYGGTGNWQWSIPTPEGIGPQDGIGIFGHGAVMLPGSVMMIAGGYLTPKSGKRKEKRVDLSSNHMTYFFNTSSSSWIPSFDPPQTVPETRNSSAAAATRNNSNAAKKAGLQAGLTLGILALMGIVCFYFWYTRRANRRREAREQDLRTLAAGAHRVNSSQLPIGGPGGEMTAVEWTRERSRSSTDAYPWGSALPRSVGERVREREAEKGAERTGLLFEIPSPTRGLRKSLQSRGAYQPAPRFEDGRLSHGPGNIHPIDERDEYEDGGDRDPLRDAETSHGRDGDNIIQSAPILDPFRDSSRSPSPESPTHAREIEVQNWVSDWAAADALMHHQPGRLSPDRTDRTSSTLSDKSARSTISANSYMQAGSSIGRSLSQRSSVLLGTRPLSSHNNPTIITTAPSESQNGPRLPQHHSTHNHRRTRSLTLFSNSRGPNTSSSDSKTPTTSFPQLQLESEALLGGYQGPRESSPTRLQGRARGWMGSMRRALVGSDRSTADTRSASSSPTKYYHHTPEASAGIPRRAASTGAMLWKKKQGAKDWDVEENASLRKESSKGDSMSCGEADDDGEWDIESAVERRVVQVMFTVPKEKLRVVNRGPDGDGVSVMSTELVEPQKEEKGKEKENEGKSDEKDPGLE